MGWLTLDELREVNAEVTAIIRRYEDRIADPDRRPEGSTLVEMVAWAVPVEVAR
jgi:hypothetical protein